jgi:hypothetical protein
MVVILEGRTGTGTRDREPMSVISSHAMRLTVCSWPHPSASADIPMSVMLWQSLRVMVCSWSHRWPSADTPISVMLWQPSRSIVSSWPHPPASADMLMLSSLMPLQYRSPTAYSWPYRPSAEIPIFVMLSHSLKFIVSSCLHPLTSADSPMSVMPWQSPRLMARSWPHPSASAGMPLSVIRWLSLRLIDSRSLHPSQNDKVESPLPSQCEVGLLMMPIDPNVISDIWDSPVPEWHECISWSTTL